MAGPAADVRVRGLDELAAGTKELARNVPRAAATQFGRVAEQVAGTVAGNVPHLTGRLAAGTRAHTVDGGATVQMGEGVPYAGYVEYGGRGHPPSPQGNYLYPAAMDAEPAIVAAGEKAATDAIGATRWPTPN